MPEAGKLALLIEYSLLQVLDLGQKLWICDVVLVSCIGFAAAAGTFVIGASFAQRPDVVFLKGARPHRRAFDGVSFLVLRSGRAEFDGSGSPERCLCSVGDSCDKAGCA